jgi:hypothetical protein
MQVCVGALVAVAVEVMVGVIVAVPVCVAVPVMVGVGESGGAKPCGNISGNEQSGGSSSACPFILGAAQAAATATGTSFRKSRRDSLAIVGGGVGYKKSCKIN